MSVFFILGVVSSEVERFLDTEEVRSSILLPPTTDNKGSGDFLLNLFLTLEAPLKQEVSHSLRKAGARRI